LSSYATVSWSGASTPTQIRVEHILNGTDVAVFTISTGTVYVFPMNDIDAVMWLSIVQNAIDFAKTIQILTDTQDAKYTYTDLSGVTRPSSSNAGYNYCKGVAINK
jgi:hypothetical protein